MTKFERKLDNLMWFILSILPILIYFIVNFQTNGTVVDFSTFIAAYRFDFVADIINNILTVSNMSIPLVVVDVVSYFSSVLLARLFIEVINFFIKFALSLLGALYEKIS